MVSWEEELKIERKKQVLHSQYEAYLNSADEINEEQIGKLQGKSYKRLESASHSLSHFVNPLIKHN